MKPRSLNPQCPYCKSDRTNKNGHNQTKTGRIQKYWCMDCQAGFQAIYKEKK